MGLTTVEHGGLLDGGHLLAAEQAGEEENLPVVTSTGSRRSSTAKGVASGSPGVLSGNQIQIPESVEVNRCGNSTVGVVSIFDPAYGNVCANA
ncbi:chaplin [Kitasatospora sp. NPDC096077]|uniref:chaplin n=1 Tax=Kitasatospora sp. NPDC096077 TaxID=3155544 RepID=UPI0033266360